MSRPRGLFVTRRALLVLGLALSACARGVPPRPAPSRAVQVRGFTFAPAELVVGQGDTVVWINEDGFPHSTVSDSAAWSSPELGTGDRFMYVAVSAGRFPYHCAAHPVMQGVLVVR